MPKNPLGDKRIIRFKVIRAVYEKLTVREGTDEYLTKAVSNSQTVYSLFSFLQHESKEHFIVLHLDAKNKILCIDRVSVGTMMSSVVHPREVFKTALLSSATAVILLHNHPSGDPNPSRDDISLTAKLQQAGELMGIVVLDHVIIGDGYISLKEKGYL